MKPETRAEAARLLVDTGELWGDEAVRIAEVTRAAARELELVFAHPDGRRSTERWLGTDRRLPVALVEALGDVMQASRAPWTVRGGAPAEADGAPYRGGPPRAPRHVDLAGAPRWARRRVRQGRRCQPGGVLVQARWRQEPLLGVRYVADGRPGESWMALEPARHLWRPRPEAEQADPWSRVRPDAEVVPSDLPEPWRSLLRWLGPRRRLPLHRWFL